MLNLLHVLINRMWEWCAKVRGGKWPGRGGKARKGKMARERGEMARERESNGRVGGVRNEVR